MDAVVAVFDALVSTHAPREGSDVPARLAI